MYIFLFQIQTKANFQKEIINLAILHVNLRLGSVQRYILSQIVIIYQENKMVASFDRLSMNLISIIHFLPVIPGKHLQMQPGTTSTKFTVVLPGWRLFFQVSNKQCEITVPWRFSLRTSLLLAPDSSYRFELKRF